ncbi:hypothetical protein PoB_002336700 [Plakobranchus ocellatus]|uniref:Uncharacterized protein n=1 Tax=Plakobranchus ocellatus TaxID=259542 RepID=A0AAV3ZQT9_9GAST|nr:hypothetical protein PoB_002336700 [Plakobranchus ocellatus]
MRVSQGRISESRLENFATFPEKDSDPEVEVKGHNGGLSHWRNIGNVMMRDRHGLVIAQSSGRVILPVIKSHLICRPFCILRHDTVLSLGNARDYLKDTLYFQSNTNDPYSVVTLPEAEQRKRSFYAITETLTARETKKSPLRYLTAEKKGSDGILISLNATGLT